MTFNSWHVPNHLYFITASITGWKHLFNNPAYANIVLNSLSWLRQEKRLMLFVFALLPTHLHAIIKPLDRSIGDVLQNFGSFTAHAMLKKLWEDNQLELLEYFHGQRRNNEEEHSLWQDIQAKNIFTGKYLWQKMEYIHQNPVTKEWKLATDRADYEYSSACYYDREEKPIIEVDDIREYLL